MQSQPHETAVLADAADPTLVLSSAAASKRSTCGRCAYPQLVFAFAYRTCRADKDHFEDFYEEILEELSKVCARHESDFLNVFFCAVRRSRAGASGGEFRRPFVRQRLRQILS